MMMQPECSSGRSPLPTDWIVEHLPEVTARLAALARRLLHSRITAGKDPDDLVQDAILRAIEKADSFQDYAGETLEKWLAVVLRHNAINLLRREGQFQHSREAIARPVQNDPEAAAARQEVDETVAAVFGRLGAEDRELVALRYLVGLSWANIGLRFRLTADTTRKRVSRAVARLHDLLTAADGNEPMERKLFPLQ